MTLLDDLRLAFRLISKAPGFSALNLVILALGLGAAIYGYSALNAIVLKPLPFDHGERLMHLETAVPERDIDSREVMWDDFRDWREQQTVFEDLAGFYRGTVNIAGGDRPERFEGAFISPSAFPMLRVDPLLGRTFRAEEGTFGAPDVIILGHKVWQQRYNGDREIVGKMIRANGRDTEVIGVMPENFEFPVSDEVWLPLRVDESDRQRGEGMTLEVFGRLTDGASTSSARAQLVSLAAQLAQAYPDTNAGVTAVVKPYGHEYVGTGTIRAIWTMMAAVTMVLLIACANVANLLLARNTARTQEIAVRAAIGAGRLRLTIQMLMESFIISLAAAGLGMVLAYWGTRFTDYYFAKAGLQFPFWVRFETDVSAAWFAIVAAVVACLIGGLIPALRASSSNINAVLRQNSRGSTHSSAQWLSRSLVVFEIALSFALLVAAGLTVRSALAVQNVDLGVRQDGQYLTARIGLPEAEYDEQQQIAFFEQLSQQLSSIPGVAAGGLTSSIPGVWPSMWRPYVIEGGDEQAKEAELPWSPQIAIDDNFFNAFGISLLSGRPFDDRDQSDGEKVVIVDEYFLEALPANVDPLSQRVRLGSPSDADQPPAWHRIVGVAPRIFHQSVGDSENRDPVFYVPLRQQPLRFMSVALRTEGDPAQLAPALRDQVARMDSNLPLYWVESLDTILTRSRASENLLGIIFSTFALIALVLAAGGLYGVIAYSVGQRTQELGVRRALGASDRSIFRLIFRQATYQSAAGIALGLLLGAVVAFALRDILVDVDVSAPWLYALVGLLLLACTAVASYLPTRRAVRIDPSEALRYE